MTKTGFDWTRTLNVTITLESVECCNCGIPEALLHTHGGGS